MSVANDENKNKGTVLTSFHKYLGTSILCSFINFISLSLMGMVAGLGGGVIEAAP
jgi:hypothetical protein